ncbi:ABC transporter substrate-binding protein [Microlunatus parietis]|uniref:Cellobiose transport system substrate-binding protein n=1 Tax=Microlunatus parietis TaxID=682979 RepID=A0A7Y9I7D2_9ACTN|nr:extracellular solute-binding protein [Microlunatus parietis]NYE71346.1 cellobiose transport system substrate-binding protein [Microlunatus parietis]
MTRWSRRGILGLGGAALAAGMLPGCGGQTSISADPRELVLWYWNRSVSPTLLEQAAQQIPGTDKRLRADTIGGTFDSKLRTSLAGGSYIPDVSGINSNCSLYFLAEDKFLDLRDYGAGEVEGDYYPWKWKLGTTPTGRFCFWPMDTGPTGFYYRTDLFQEANLPTEPADVSAQIGTWEAWIELGEKLRTNSDRAIINAGRMVYSQYINASAERYFDEQNRPLYSREGSAVRAAWDTAVRAIQAGITARQVSNSSGGQNAAWVSGKTAGHIEAVWWGEILKDTAPDTAGNWRIASQPVKAGNSGGSFLAVPATCKDPEAAVAFIRWLTTPENQAATFNEIQLFPSTPASFASGSMRDESGFFGDQDALDFFAEAAADVPTTFVSTYEAQVGAFAKEIDNVETAGKDPERAWDDAVSLTDGILAKRGVL